MTAEERREDETARLLASQLDALARYRHIVEAQRAVLRMGDAGLLEVFSREADGIMHDITARENQLLAIRAAAQPVAGPDSPLADLQTRVASACADAAADATSLTRDMEREATGIAQSIRETSDELTRLLHGYSRPPTLGRPFLVDRTG